VANPARSDGTGVLLILEWGNEMKFFFKLAALSVLLTLVSCTEDLSDGTIVFYNFSPVVATELNVFSSVETSSRRDSVYVKSDLAYAYSGGISPATYHMFVLPEDKYFFEVKTEEGETYEGGPFSNSYKMAVVFSVDYDVLEYEE
jgi:hypothetical protein